MSSKANIPGCSAIYVNELCMEFYDKPVCKRYYILRSTAKHAPLIDATQTLVMRIADTF